MDILSFFICLLLFFPFISFLSFPLLLPTIYSVAGFCSFTLPPAFVHLFSRRFYSVTLSLIFIHLLCRWLLFIYFVTGFYSFTLPPAAVYFADLY